MYTTNVNVTQSEAGEMLEYFTAKKTQLKTANKDVFKKLDEYQAMIDKLNAIVKSDGIRYPKNGSWNDRIKFILAATNGGLTSRQIVDAIADMEDIDGGSDEWKSIYKGVAPSLSTGNKIYGKRPNSDGSTVYTLL